MTSGSPWSVKGIDPKAREIAKDLARRSGMTLGEWLNTVIYDDNAETPAGAPSIRAAGPTQDRPPTENQMPRRSGDDLDRVLASIDELSQRFDMAAREQAETAARFEAAIADLKSDQARVSERIQGVERSGGGGAAPDGKAETLRALEAALNKVAGHLANGEQRHRDSMAEMRQELGDEMMRVAEQVNRKVLEVENRSADAIAQVGAEVTRVATAVEQRMRRADDVQAEALEKLGGEIARITERLSERIAAAERRAAQAVEDVGQQVARVTDRIHQRQERSESELAIRMRQSEERTAKLLEEARQVIERRLGRGAGHEPEPAESKTHAEPATAPGAESEAHAELWKAAEPEAADIAAGDLGVHASPSEPAPVFLDPPAIVPDAEAIEEQGLSAEVILEAEGLAELLAAEDEPEPVPDMVTDDEPPARPTPVPFQAYTPTLTADAAFTAADDLEAMDAVAQAINAPDTGPLEIDAPRDVSNVPREFRPPEPTPAPYDIEAEDVFVPPPAAERPVFAADVLNAEEDDDQLRPSTLELIAQAKAAAFTEPNAYRPRPAETATSDDVLDEPLTSAFADPRPGKIRSNYTMRTALFAGGAAGFMVLAGAGYVAMNPELMRKTGLTLPAKPIPVGPASHPTTATAAAPAPTQAAVALATAPTPKDNVTDLDAMYRDAAAKVDANDPMGVAPLRTAANLGYAPAQRRLGKLYEDGGAGIEKDPTEGRRWTFRAAGNGDARAMHNLGLDYYEGIGGPKSLPVAASWFQKAAELGLRDSQYNLARFMEAGVGVPQDLPGAYRWYLIAARAGDTEAQTRADALKAKLSADEASRSQTLAGAFRPDPAAAPASLKAMLQANSAKQLALAQRALGKLGYYKGPNDGAPSQALGEAIQSYQRERGLASNGQLSPELVQTFAHIAQ